MLQADLKLPTPTRSEITDDPEAILRFALAACEAGERVALATLVEMRGGGARSLGAQMAVSADGRYCGYVSGGCVEAAVASEALLAMEDGRDRVVSYGVGSPYFDIVLPCGGAITVAIHVVRQSEPLAAMVECLGLRQPAALRYSPSRQRLEVGKPADRSGWRDEVFVTVYSPRTRIVMSGGNIETHALAMLARTAGLDVVMTRQGDGEIERAIDGATAVVLLHHDLEAEASVLDAALRSRAFYIGALGSTRTHKDREDRLTHRGYTKSDLARIKAPIGYFGPTRDANSLAISVLADITAARLSAGSGSVA